MRVREEDELVLRVQKRAMALFGWGLAAEDMMVYFKIYVTNRQYAMFLLMQGDLSGQYKYDALYPAVAGLIMATSIALCVLKVPRLDHLANDRSSFAEDW